MGSCSIGFCLAKESEMMIEEKMTAIETARSLGPGAHSKDPQFYDLSMQQFLPAGSTVLHSGGLIGIVVGTGK